MISIPCCIVDDHCDIVPFLHSCYRSKIIPLNKSPPSFYHFDSHSDLSVPKSSSTQQWQHKDELYELLAGEDGISEFILPLMYTGYLGDIIWLRPHWCTGDMVEDGVFSFAIGDIIGKDIISCGVTLPSNYYLDDGTYCNINDIDPKSSKQCCLKVITIYPLPVQHHVTSMSSTANVPQPSSSVAATINPWILDICLDYFTVSNPFLVKISAAISRDIASLAGHSLCPSLDDAINILTSCYYQLPYRKKSKIESMSAHDIIQERDKTHDAMNQLLTQDTVDDIPSSLHAVCFPDNDALAMKFSSLLQHLSCDTKALLVEYGLLLLLPHYIASDYEIRHNVAAFVTAISTMHTCISPPLAITIATSAEDEYTPTHTVDELKSMVIDAIREQLLPLWQQRMTSSSTSLAIDIYDYSQVDDVETATYTMFLHKKCQSYVHR